MEVHKFLSDQRLLDMKICKGDSMTYAELIFELKRLSEFALGIDEELAQELSVLISQYEVAQGECCG